MKYKYFMSYQGLEGFGSQEVIMNVPITEYKQIEEIGKLIAKEHGYKEVVILFYTLLG